jgi:hypothetical protein
MKLNLELKPKEWVLVALFIIVLYLAFNGHINEAVDVLSKWLPK